MKVLFGNAPTKADLVATGADAARNSRFYSGGVESHIQSVVYFDGEFDPSEYEAAGIECAVAYRAGKAPKKKATRKKRAKK